MNTVIVPVDFSETSRNSAFYATHLLTGHYGVEMILYHIYDKASHAAEANKHLEELKNELMQAGIVKIKFGAFDDPFIEVIIPWLQLKKNIAAFQQTEPG